MGFASYFKIDPFPDIALIYLNFAYDDIEKDEVYYTFYFDLLRMSHQWEKFLNDAIQLPKIRYSLLHMKNAAYYRLQKKSFLQSGFFYVNFIVSIMYLTPSFKTITLILIC